MMQRVAAFMTGMILSALVIMIIVSLVASAGGVIFGSSIGPLGYSYIGVGKQADFLVMRASRDGVSIGVCAERNIHGGKVRLGGGPRIDCNTGLSYEASLEALWKTDENVLVGFALLARDDIYAAVLEIEFRPGGEWRLLPDAI